MTNIDQLDSAGDKVCAWCFVPEGNLAAGDCMLAQKIAQETFETKVLAIANRKEMVGAPPLRRTGYAADRRLSAATELSRAAWSSRDPTLLGTVTVSRNCFAGGGERW
jgi:hypothetical protein